MVNDGRSLRQRWDQHLYIIMHRKWFSKCCMALKHVTVPLTNDKMVVCLFSETYQWGWTCFWDGPALFSLFKRGSCGADVTVWTMTITISMEKRETRSWSLFQNEFMFFFLDSRWIMYSSWMIIYDYIWTYIYNYIWVYMNDYECVYIYREDGNQSIINLYRHFKDSHYGMDLSPSRSAQSELRKIVNGAEV